MNVSRNAAYTLIGAVAPAVVGILTVPLYIDTIGPDRYGVLAIAFLILGYFGLFDLGLGKSVNFQISSLNDEESPRLPIIVGTAICVNLFMGLGGAVFLFIATKLLIVTEIGLDQNIRSEIGRSAIFIALTLPLASLIGTLIGVLQAKDKFRTVNKISLSSTVVFQFLPLIAAFWIEPRLPILMAAVLLARLLTAAVLFLFTLRETRQHGVLRFRRDELKGLLAYGGWITVANMFGPILVLLDRFLIGGVLGPASVTVYTVPYQLAQRISIIPGSLLTALFPRLPSETAIEQFRLTEKATKIVISLLTPTVFSLIYIINPFFDIWLGKEIGSQSAEVGVLIFLGFWINGLAIVPYTLLQAQGRPDKVTKTLLVEIPPYVALLLFSLKYYGLLGCSAVFAFRCAVDFILMSIAARGKVTHAALVFGLGTIMLIGCIANYIYDYRQPQWWISFVVLIIPIAAVSWITLPADLRNLVVAYARARLSFLRP